MEQQKETSPLPETDYDVIVVGGAAAGLTAALYASRRTLKTLIVTKSLGGQLAMTPSIENFPGTKKAGGMELMMRFLEHAQEYGAEIVYETVKALRKRDDGVFEVESTGAGQGVRTAKAVILAFGLTPRNLEVPGEEELQGRGVTYCATCDGPLFKEKRVAVVGGTYEALDAALLLAKLNAEVTLVHKGAGYPNYKKLFAAVEEHSNITVKLETVITRIEGEQKVEAVVLQGTAEGSTEERVELDGVFVENGHKIDSSWVGDLVDYAKGGSIMVNEVQETKTDGLYAAGDVTPQRDKQAIISAGAGATAALSAYQYIQKASGKPSLRVDWQHTDEV